MSLGPVRAEDSFAVEALSGWLDQRVAGLVGPPEVLQFAGGASNLTYLLRYPDREVILRRPPAGTKAASAHDMGREFRVQQALAPAFAQVPAMIAHCEDAEVIGSPFYVMEHVPGLILRSELPDGMTLEPERARALGLGSYELLARLHGVDAEAIGLASLGKGPGYVQRQISGWSGRYRAARTEDVPDGEEVMAWLDAHQPQDVDECVIHGDWRFDNMVLDPDTLQVRAVLDWEMATIGDPLMDLGASLAYWIQADDDEGFRLFRRQPTHLPGMPTRAEIVDHYLHISGRSLPVDWRFYEVYGLFRLAVIAQQIWYRYSAGQTTNPAYAVFGPAVSLLLARCASRIAA